MKQKITKYFNILGNLPLSAEITDQQGSPISLESVFSDLTLRMQQAHELGNKLMWIGNGGSSTIASHMAVDYSKNGGIRSLAFNDSAALTCLGNDLGYENVFAKQIEMHARPGDILIAISSSGQSPNIIKAVDTARERGCYIVTFSGFSPENALRNFGDCNIYIRATEYGFVEISHLALCHAILDLSMGWGKEIAHEEHQAVRA